MSDIEREEFEQAVTDRWSDSYSFTRFGDEDYYDEVLEGMWRGWQASRQVDGESVAYITERKLEWLKSGPVLSAVVYRKHSEGSIPLYTHPASRQAVSVPKQWVDLMRELVKDLISEIKTKQKLKPDERVAEDLGAVREAIAMIEKQEQGHEWIKCSEQRPNVLDVWIKMTDGSVVACWSQLDGDFYWNGGGSESYILENTVTHWKPRQQEQDHE